MIVVSGKEKSTCIILHFWAEIPKCWVLQTSLHVYSTVIPAFAVFIVGWYPLLSHLRVHYDSRSCTGNWFSFSFAAQAVLLWHLLFTSNTPSYDKMCVFALSPVAFCFGRWVSGTRALILFLAKVCCWPSWFIPQQSEKAKHMGVHWIFSASYPRDKINSVDILTGPKSCHLENCLNKTCLSRFNFSSYSKNNWFIFIEFLSSQRTPYAFQKDISIQAIAETQPLLNCNISLQHEAGKKVTWNTAIFTQNYPF